MTAVLGWDERHAPGENGVDDGTRTHDDRNHNPGLYQLSYVHHCHGRVPRPLSSLAAAWAAATGRWRARQDSNLQPSA
jgi:hypothetical protein